MNWKMYTDVAEEIARHAGAVLMSYWGKVEQIKTKSYYWDLVTEADTASDKLIAGELHRFFPNHRVLTEESGEAISKESEYLWVVDPLDGTTNYSHGFPIFAVSIGLQYRGESVAGVVYHPLYQEMFSASRGGGAHFNGEKMKVSGTTELQKSVLATGFAYDRANNPDNNYQEFCHFTDISQGVRRLGSAALDLAYVAAGRLDGYWERGLKPWDLAAGSLLVEEAGGRVSGYDLKSLDYSTGRVLATNGKIHNLLADELVKFN